MLIRIKDLSNFTLTKDVLAKNEKGDEWGELVAKSMENFLSSIRPYWFLIIRIVHFDYNPPF